MARTLLDKLWDAHVVEPLDGGRDLLYIDLHLIHEVTTPQAFEGLRLAGRRVRRPDRTVATLDHNVSTGPRHLPMTDALADAQLRGAAQPTARPTASACTTSTRRRRASSTSSARSSA